MEDRKLIRLTRIVLSLTIAVGLGILLALVLLPSSAGARPIEPGAVAESPPRLRAAVADYEQRIRLVKNEDYYDAASVVVTQVTSLFIEEEEAWARYQTGELDTISPPDSALPTIKASTVYSSHLYAYPGTST